MNEWFLFIIIFFNFKIVLKILYRYFVATSVDYAALNSSNNNLYGVAHNYSKISFFLFIKNLMFN